MDSGALGRIITDMDTKDLIKYQIAASAKQVDKVLEGLADDKWGAKSGNGMSPGETVVHLTECYVAAQTHLSGGTHEWGSYTASEETPTELAAKMRSERSKAWEAILGANDEEAGKAATEYLVLHDAYHVGQLATLRMGVDPEWDAYSIYE